MEIKLKIKFNYGTLVIEKTDVNNEKKQVIGFISKGNKNSLLYILSSNEGEIARYDFELEKVKQRKRKKVGFKTEKTK